MPFPTAAAGERRSREQRLDMCSTCKYPFHMSRMIQVRHVPDTLHRTLKARAAMTGMSLSDYLLLEFRRICERPTMLEMRARLQRCTPTRPHVSAADLVREERERN